MTCSQRGPTPSTRRSHLPRSVGGCGPGDSVESAGGRASPTAAHPAYLDVSGVLYRADGTKNGDRWVLRPVNEVQTVETPVQLNNALTLKNGQYSDAVTADLGVRPYDRIVQAYFTIWGRVSNGDVDADLRILGRSFRARFPMTPRARP